MPIPSVLEHEPCQAPDYLVVLEVEAAGRCIQVTVRWANRYRQARQNNVRIERVIEIEGTEVLVADEEAARMAGEASMRDVERLGDE